MSRSLLMALALQLAVSGTLFAASHTEGGRDESTNRQSLEESTRGSDRADLRRPEERGQQDSDKAETGIADRMQEVDKNDEKSKDKDKDKEKEKEKEKEKAKAKEKESSGSDRKSGDKSKGSKKGK